MADRDSLSNTYCFGTSERTASEAPLSDIDPIGALSAFHTGISCNCRESFKTLAI